MKHFITFVFILLSYLSYGQITGTQVLAFQGNVTTTVRNTLDVPTGQYWMIYNTTTAQLEVSDDTDTWSAFTAGTDDQTAAEVPITDAGGIITATDVEGALQENRTAIDLNTAKVTNATHTGDVTGSGALTIATGAVAADELASTTVTPGSYTNTDLTVDADGRITAASNGSAGGGLASTDIDTYSELNTIVADVTLTHNGLFDTSSELAGILGDETGTGNAMFSASPTTTGTLTTDNIRPSVDGSAMANTVGSASLAYNLMYSLGYIFKSNVAADINWYVKPFTDEDLEFRAEATPNSASYPAATYKLNASGTPTDANDLVDKAYADALGGGTVDTSGTPADNQLAIFTDANTIEGSGLITFNGTTFTVDAPLELSQNQLNNVTGVEWVYTTGSNEVQTGFSGGNDIFFLGGPNDASQALRYTFSTGEWYYPVAGTPTNYSITLANVQDHLEGIDTELGVLASATSLPVADGTSIVEGSADATKELRFEVDGLTTGTTRVITMADENIDLNNRVETTTALTNSIPIYTIVAGNQADVNGWAADPNRLDVVLDAAGTNLAEADQAIPASTTRVVNTDASGSSVSFENAGTEVMRVGNNNDAAVFVLSMEALTGDVIGLISPIANAQRSITTDAAADFDHAIISESTSSLPYFSNGTVWLPVGGNSRVVTSATISMTGNVMYDDQTADAATITLSDCNAGDELTVYINRASAPTLAGTGLTFNQLPGTTAFAAATEMGIVFQVAYNGTTVDYYYFER